MAPSTAAAVALFALAAATAAAPIGLPPSGSPGAATGAPIHRQARTLYTLGAEKWFDLDGGRIPYFLDPSLEHDQANNFLLAVQKVVEVTQLKFVGVKERASAGRHIWVRDCPKAHWCGGNCVGPGQSVRELCLNTEILPNQYGTALHELGHALGLQHEHMRKDRDEFITVNNKYTYHPKGCVSGNNIRCPAVGDCVGNSYQGKTVEQCKDLCDANDACVAFEYGVDHGGNRQNKPKDCILQSSADRAGCQGAVHNLDLYVSPAATIAGMKQRNQYSISNNAASYGDYDFKSIMHYPRKCHGSVILPAWSTAGWCTLFGGVFCPQSVQHDCNFDLTGRGQERMRALGITVDQVGKFTDLSTKDITTLNYIHTKDSCTGDVDCNSDEVCRQAPWCSGAGKCLYPNVCKKLPKIPSCFHTIAATWNAGYGKCASYTKSSKATNFPWCHLDKQSGLLASQVCSECGKCADPAGPANKGPAATITHHGTWVYRGKGECDDRNTADQTDWAGGSKTAKECIAYCYKDWGSRVALSAADGNCKCGMRKRGSGWGFVADGATWNMISKGCRLNKGGHDIYAM